MDINFILFIVKILIIKYGMYANMFAERMWVACAIAKTTHTFSAEIPVNLVYLLEQLTFWSLTNSLG